MRRQTMVTLARETISMPSLRGFTTAPEAALYLRAMFTLRNPGGHPSE